MATGARIFQPTDLRRDRSFIDYARDQGRARLRDTEGLSFVLMRERDLEDLERREARMRKFTEASWAMVDLLNGRHIPDAWAWLRVFDAEDRESFSREVVEALRIDLSDVDSNEFDRALDAWRETAAAMRDNERYAALTRPIAIDTEILDN